MTTPLALAQAGATQAATVSSTHTGRWDVALAHAYPTPHWAGLLRADLAWAEKQLDRGYYDDIPGKPQKVRDYLASARAHIARIERRAAA